MVQNKCERKESGQALVTVTIALLVLLLFGALAIDVGQMYMRRRHMQNAADAGALAGARELCIGHTTAQAIAAASDYAGARNNAPQVSAAVEGNIVVVTTTIPVTSYLAQLIGVNTTDVHAVARAACGEATSGCGIFPIAFDQANWEDVPCGAQFIVWGDENESVTNGGLCDSCVCASATQIDPGDLYNGRNQLSSGHRGWVLLPDPSVTGAYPNPYACDDNCGASSTNCWILHDWLGEAEIGQCIPGDAGVTALNLDAAITREGDTVSVLIWDSGACNGYLGTCPPSPDYYRLAEFGCMTIEYVWVNKSGHSTLSLAKRPAAECAADSDCDPDYDCPKNHKAILVRKVCDLNACMSNCGGTDGSTPVPGGISAVSLVD